MSSDAELIAWAKAHGPAHLRFAAERGPVEMADVMDAMVQSLAEHVGGRVMRPADELIHWQPRKDPHPTNLERAARLGARLFAWATAAELICVVFERGEVVRVEEQTVVTDPTSVLKYSGIIITVSLAERKWFVLVNLEAGK